MTTAVYCTTRFEGYHRWNDAPEEVAFLRERHRHMFHVKLMREVIHADREVEFILMKHELNRVIAGIQMSQSCETWSCERWATELREKMDALECEVSEDGENGAVAF